MTDPVTVIVWRDAKNDPPEHERYVWTDVGESCFWGRKWSDTDGGPPTVWCDPIPPAADALTTDDLSWAIGAVDDVTRRHEEDGPSQASQEYVRQGREVSARLRRAIEEA